MKSRYRFLAGVLLLGGAIAVVGGRWRESSRGGHSPSPAEARGSNGALANATPNATGSESGVVSDGLTAKAAATVGRIREMLSTIEPVLPGEIENAAAIELLRWWGEIEPIAAMEFVASHPHVHGRATLAAELFVSWLDRSRDDAMQWFNLRAAGELRWQILPMVISAVAQQQPRVALGMMVELTGETRQAAVSALFSEWGATDPRVAGDHALRLPNPLERNEALRLVLGKWMDRDMPAAIAWARTLPPAPEPDSIDVLPPVTELLIEKWVSFSPTEAASHARSGEEGPARTKLLGKVAAQWAITDPAGALRWARVNAGGEEQAVMVRGVLATVAASDVQAAVELATSVEFRAAGAQGLGMVIDQWVARDPAGLSVWAGTLAARSEAHESLRPLVGAWAAADLEGVGRWIEALPPGTARDACCAAVSGYLASKDERLSLRWADAIANLALRQQQRDAVRARQ